MVIEKFNKLLFSIFEFNDETKVVTRILLNEDYTLMVDSLETSISYDYVIERVLFYINSEDINPYVDFIQVFNDSFFDCDNGIYLCEFVVYILSSLSGLITKGTWITLNEFNALENLTDCEKLMVNKALTDNPLVL